MATIYIREYPSKKKGQRPRKVWWIQYRIGDRLVRRSLKTSSKRVAERELDVLKERLLRPHRKAPEDKNERIDKFWKAYIRWMEGSEKAPATIALHEYFWKQLTEFTQATRLGDISREDIEALKVWMRKKKRPNSPQTVNNALKDLRTIFNRAAELGFYTGENPVNGVERFKIGKRIVTFHSEKDARKLIKTVTKADPTTDERNLEWVVLLGLCAGLRRKEIINMRWEWLKFTKKPTIEIRERADFKIKTRDARTIPMSRLIFKSMRPHRKKSGFVLESDRESTGRSRYRWDPQKGLVAALERAGLRTDSAFQNLRRTFGSIHVQHGKSYEIVSQWMGNSVKVVERYYVGLNLGDEDINVF